ncbi:MAG: hypothetical protein HY899_04460 [Deltaproteobacteria bacterium]|nr:hypothetical protein [Deltaproteobacteria bacterium]
MELLTRQRTPRPSLRTVDVAPPSAGDEATWVTLAALFIVLCVVYVVGFERYDSRAPAPAAAQASLLLPHQVFFRDLPGKEQRTFREMREGATEALAMRAAAGAWPSVETLASQGMPPFTADPLDESRLAWTLRREEGSAALIFQYVGIPAAAGATASFLIFVQEPDAQTGEKPTASMVDEEHQLLPDGKLLHVTYWKHAAAGVPGDLIREPALGGWQQIRVRSPFEELEDRRG